jgi:hypothetical protein
MSNYARVGKLVGDLSSAAKCGDEGETERLRKLLNDLRSEVPKCKPDVNQVIAGYGSDRELVIHVHDTIADVLDRFHEAHLMTLDEGDDREVIEGVVVSILKEVILVRSYILSPRFVKFVQASPIENSLEFCASLATQLVDLRLGTGEPDHFARLAKVKTQMDMLKIAVSGAEPLDHTGLSTPSEIDSLSTYSIMELKKACDVSNDTLKRYGIKVVKDWPKRGQHGLRFSKDDAIKIVTAVRNGTSRSCVKDSCKAWLGNPK